MLLNGPSRKLENDLYNQTLGIMLNMESPSLRRSSFMCLLERFFQPIAFVRPNALTEAKSRDYRILSGPSESGAQRKLTMNDVFLIMEKVH